MQSAVRVVCLQSCGGSTALDALQGHAWLKEWLTQSECAGERAVEALMSVDRSVVPWFRAAAKQLLAAVDSPEEALAMALAKVTGHSVLQVCCCLCGTGLGLRVRLDQLVRHRSWVLTWGCS